MTFQELKERDVLIKAIEEKTGTLMSVEWYKVTLEDMIKLHDALVSKKSCSPKVNKSRRSFTYWCDPTKFNL